MEENPAVGVTNIVYRLLDTLPESDPLKNRAKEKALAVLESSLLVFSAHGWVSLQKEKAAAQLLDDLRILEGYLNIGKTQGWIDTMNFLIITKEYRLVKSLIKAPEGIIRKGLEVVNLAVKEKEIVKQKRIEKKTTAPPAVVERYSPRQEIILKVLNGKEKAQVAEFMKALPKVTKRTVRRDLDNLLKRGKIIRIGEWNRASYSRSDRTFTSNVKMS